MENVAVLENKKKSTPIGAFLTFVLKSTKVFKILKIVKILKPFFFLFSMLLSIAAYSPLLGIQVAIMLVVLLFIHEMGHVWALKLQGEKIRMPLFIPFLGAVIFSPPFYDRVKEAKVGIAGPALGTLGALLCLPIYFIFDSKLWLVGAALGLYLNIFNMLTISPLDGGRITQVVSKYFKILGFLGLLWVTLIDKDAGMLVIWIMVSTDFLTIKTPRAIKTLLILLSSGIVVLMIILGIGFKLYHSGLAYIVDLSLAFLLLSFEFYIYFRFDDTDFEELRSPRPMPKTSERIKWLFLFLGLLVIQIVSLVEVLKLLK